MHRAARFDATRTYRYALRRAWASCGGRALFVMLNPSTADERLEDPTLRRCIGFAQREGMGSLEVVNLFAYCTPYPRVLARAADPVGPWNDRTLRHALRRADRIVVAWGNGAPDRASRARLDRRVAAFRSLVGGAPVQCLGLTRRGHPRHPLRLPADQPFRPWPAGR